MPRARIGRFYIQKPGNDLADYEDAFDFHAKTRRSQNHLEGPVLRFALADGATVSSFTQLWAKMVASAYAHAHLNSTLDLGQGVQALSGHWHKQIHRGTLPWYAQAGAGRGALTTLLGLEIRAGESMGGSPNIWDTIAVGDTCLFHIRGERLLQAFPLTGASDFGNNPDLISSVVERNVGFEGRVKTTQGYWAVGDIFMLATDAMAAWFCRQMNLGQQPWLVVQQWIDDARPALAFHGWVLRAWESGSLTEDDITIVRIEMTGP